jgi:hypothetical protein
MSQQRSLEMVRSLKPPPPPLLPSLKRVQTETVSLLALSRLPQVSPQRKQRSVSTKFMRVRKPISKSNYAGRNTAALQKTGMLQKKLSPSTDCERMSVDESEHFAPELGLTEELSGTQVDEPNEHGSSLAQYIDAVQSECVGFISLIVGLFAVEGWNRTSGAGTVSCILLGGSRS